MLQAATLIAIFSLIIPIYYGGGRGQHDGRDDGGGQSGDIGEQVPQIKIWGQAP